MEPQDRALLQSVVCAQPNDMKPDELALHQAYAKALLDQEKRIEALEEDYNYRHPTAGDE